MNSSQVDVLEQVYEVKLPQELRNYLEKYGSEVLIDGLAWSTAPDAIKEKQRQLFSEVLEFDLAHNARYWPRVFGRRPSELEKRIAQAMDYISHLPPLIPVKGLKYYVPTVLEDAGTPLPVISFQQFVDTVIACDNLSSFADGQLFSYESLPEVPGWNKVFDGLGASDGELYISLDRE